MQIQLHAIRAGGFLNGSAVAARLISVPITAPLIRMITPVTPSKRGECSTLFAVNASDRSGSKLLKRFVSCAPYPQQAVSTGPFRFRIRNLVRAFATASSTMFKLSRRHGFLSSGPLLPAFATASSEKCSSSAGMSSENGSLTSNLELPGMDVAEDSCPHAACIVSFSSPISALSVWRVASMLCLDVIICSKAFLCLSMPS
mmetsp:Transcript_44809/g.80546  ORF Transcript_44809/g.80546 Transcript_44809/m.80546 type:complete len:201 (+) Transcript_44809:789-1391(+)